MAWPRSRIGRENRYHHPAISKSVGGGGYRYGKCFCWRSDRPDSRYSARRRNYCLNGGTGRKNHPQTARIYPMISSILIANRGEIACRIIATAKRMGIRTIAIASDPDKQARHALMADAVVYIGGDSPATSYLDQ